MTSLDRPAPPRRTSFIPIDPQLPIRHARRRATARCRIGVTGWAGLALAAAGLAVLAFTGLPLLTPAAHTATVGALPGGYMPVEPQPGQPARTVGPSAPPVPVVTGQPLRLQVPAVGLDATVGAMTVAAGDAVDPPTAGSAYWLSGYGVAGPTSDNTVYIAGHTYRGGGQAVFNPFLDIPTSSYTVHTGDQVIVTTPQGPYDYTVTDTELYQKTTIQQQTQLWQKVPGRLVLVTCFQYNGGTSSQQNFVIYAQLDPGQ